MPTLCLATLGCKVNQVESAWLAERFAAGGYELVDWPGPADLCLVNTCAVTATAERQSRQMVKRARRANPQGLVIVTGCSPMVGGGRDEAFAEADLVVGNVEKAQLLELAAGLRAGAARHVGDISRVDQVQAGGAHEAHGRTRAFLKVQDGCPGHCAYCIVPRVRGPNRSVSRAAVIDAVRRLVELGHQEVVLTGIHLGLFGRDQRPPDSLDAVCRAVLEETSLLRLRLSSIEPNEVTPELIALMAGDERFCAHLHIPLQSGSDRVLRAMNRPYGTRDYEELVERLRASVPRITIGADVIVGFPGEDAAAFAETTAFLERVRLPHLHVFPYSDRPGTPAARMPGKLGRDTIKERARVVRALGRRQRIEHLRRQLGRRLRVLVEEAASGEGRGLSREYLPARVRGAVAVGREVAAQAVGLDEATVELTCESA